jgi:hypothetical protein
VAALLLAFYFLALRTLWPQPLLELVEQMPAKRHLRSLLLYPPS